MTPEERGDTVAYEQSVNDRYLRRARGRDRPNPVVEKTVATTPGAKMTDNAPTAPRVGGRIGPLLGRVALNPHDADLGQTFYIGYRYTVLGDATVLSWNAGASRLFFEGRSATASSPEAVQPRTVTARRSFQSSLDQLVDFEDDIEEDGTGAGPDPDVHFPKAAPLVVPPPPTPRLPVSPPPRAQPDPDRSVSQPPSVDSQRSAPLSASPPHGTERPADTAPTPSASRKDAGDQMRAAHLLDEAIKAPKTGALEPVLSTLQPEQYRLVTWPSDKNLVVQGHPGTGKTIVAAHRAAFLVLPRDRDDESPLLHRVALVGPTDRWREHIAPTVQDLVDEGVEVLSLESLIRDWSRGPRHALHHPTEKELHSRWAIGRIMDAAAQAQQRRLRHFKPAERLRELVNSLVRDTDIHRKYVPREGADLRDWLLDASDYRSARRDPSYLLFLAAAGIITGQLGVHGDQQHIVVDEAQDIRPVEWWMLSKMFRAGTKERWSLFGDMNQRRSEFTWQSWESLVDLLQLSDPDSEQLPEPEDLSIGYRSTREILRYAGALLPRGVPKPSALRNGPEPLIQPVGRNQLTIAAKETAERLAIRYHKGSVAVIAQHSVGEIERALLSDGWRKDAGDRQSLRKPHRSCRVSVVGPVSARGLEFDAVVVVEPADFNTSLGRHGELYTSLTRANQELVVIHSKAMPRALSGRGNRVRG